MRHHPLDSQLFVDNRNRLRKLLPPGALAALNANDVPPTNADGSLPLVPNTDLFYLSGIEQEESILVLFPDAPGPSMATTDAATVPVPWCCVSVFKGPARVCATGNAPK